MAPDAGPGSGLGGAMKSAGFRLHQPAVAALGDFLTPLERAFFVYHMGIPALDPGRWRLSVAGLVERPATLALAELAALPQIEVTAFHECAGSPLRPTEPVRRVANLTWRGVRLAEVLARVGVRPEARYLWSFGADHGVFNGVESPCYLKDLPIAETARDDVLLATHVNGEPLAEARGAPVRLVVPGYYGTNSTKWLVRLEAREIRAPGYFTTALYNDRIGEGTRPVWRVAPHSIIVAPTKTVPPGPAATTIRGWAWGAAEIARVEVDTGDGAGWRPAALAPRVGHAWQGFSLAWAPTRRGAAVLRCRATDRDGVGQPETDARNAIFELPVRVE
ncbi:MAG: molybdopterin-dependent oxidoreductase [Alphaproteobacteria bacterium]|nr:molybdopterin-dependent oxidoreductase [Alphaproteobacteria bacterium]